MSKSPVLQLIDSPTIDSHKDSDKQWHALLLTDSQEGRSWPTSTHIAKAGKALMREADEAAAAAAAEEERTKSGGMAGAFKSRTR